MSESKRKYSLILLATWGVFFAVLFGRMIEWRSDGIWVGHENVWSDWALHISLATIFAEKSPAHWFAYHPVFADGKLTYAFLVNLVSGLLMRAGVPLTVAFIVPSILTALALLEGMLRLIHLLTGSYRKALAAISVFFLSSGFGFVDYLIDVARDPRWGTVFGYTKQYSRIEHNGWLSGNVITGLLLPQRAFLLGMTLGVWGLYGLFRGLRLAESRPFSSWSRRDRALLVLSGLAVGLLPIAHMHSLIVLVMWLGPAFLAGFRKPGALPVWLGFGIPAGGLASVLFFVFVAGGIQKSGFIHWAAGYNARGFWDWLLFWGKAWGFVFPLSIWALVHRFRHGAPREQGVFFTALFLIFLVSNLVLFQPISWDNSKLLYWVYFGFSILAVEGLGRVWRLRPGRWLAPALLMGMIFTGILELWLVQRVSIHTHQLLSSEELELADLVRAKTGPLDRFLTAKVHNHFVAVRGVRPVLMGYGGWVWNYGFDYQQTERDMEVMFRGGDAAIPLLRKHRVSYVVIGPAELHEMKPDVGFFRTRFPLLAASQRFLIFDVRMQ